LSQESADIAASTPWPSARSLGDGLMRAVFDASPRPLLLMAADRPRFTMLAVNLA
jgi:hypothetical protein